MTTPRTERALRTIAKKLAGISISGGYNTDAGSRVYIGRRGFSRADCPCISVFMNNEVPAPTTGDGPAGGAAYVSCRNSLQIGIEFHVAIDQQAGPVSAVAGVLPAGSGIALQKLSADIKVAVFAVGFLTDEEIVSLESVLTKIGPIYWVGTEYQPAIEGTTTESAVMTVQVPIVEAFGDPAVVSKSTP